jgi:hypothetical protein
MAYSIVAACVLILKHEVDDADINDACDDRPNSFGKIWNSDNLRFPTKFTSNLSTTLVTLYAAFCIWMSLTASQLFDKIIEGDALSITLLVIPIVVIIFLLTCLSRQPKSAKKLAFSVPFTPWLPALSIMINIYMMTELDIATWVRFGVWLGFGLCIYIFYGRRNSILKNQAAVEPMEKIPFK